MSSTCLLQLLNVASIRFFNYSYFFCCWNERGRSWILRRSSSTVEENLFMRPKRINSKGCLCGWLLVPQTTDVWARFHPCVKHCNGFFSCGNPFLALQSLCLDKLPTVKILLSSCCHSRPAIRFIDHNKRLQTLMQSFVVKKNSMTQSPLLDISSVVHQVSARNPRIQRAMRQPLHRFC